MRNTLLYFILIVLGYIPVAAEPPLDKDANATEPFVVVLDAGHGGHDPGNLGNGYLEKEIALNIVLKVGELLSANQDIKVIYTRKDDTFIDLYVRGEIANKANADLFVSVHCDSHGSDAHGAGTFVLGLHANKQNFEIAKKENSVIYLEDNYEIRYADYDINSPESVIGLTIMQEEFLDRSIALAKLIQDNFSGKLKRTDRKVKQAGFIVLHQTFMPSVLVETGFLTNKDEGSYLNSKKGQVEMGRAIADAIIAYKGASQPTGTPKTSVVAETRVEIEQPKAVEENKETETAVIPEAKKQPTAPVVAVKEVTVKKQAAETKLTPPDGPVFKIQLLASSKDLAEDSEYFKGLSQIKKEPYNNLFRYTYGETRFYREAEMMKSRANSRGFVTAYIVAYMHGDRISITDAMKVID